MEDIVDIICFRLQKTHLDLRKVPNKEEYLLHPNWNATTFEELTQSLINQVKLNRINLVTIEGFCKDPEAIRDMQVWGYDFDPELQLRMFPHTPEGLAGEERKRLCDNFLKRHWGYKETISRDVDAILQDNFNIEIYAIVVLYNNIYQGHIYSWISPINTELAFAMGIRNRVDATFHSGDPTYLKKISSYLFEGCRRFALFKGCTSLYVTHPTQVMKPILISLGFIKDSIAEKLYGKSIAPYDIWGSILHKETVCDNCYKLVDLYNSFAHNVQIRLYE